VSRDFDVAQYTQQKKPQGMSHPNDVGVSRHGDGLLSAYILQPDLRVRAEMHRETEVAKFFCECVNRMHTGAGRSCGFETD
jgi:hypothetical protein